MGASAAYVVSTGPGVVPVALVVAVVVGLLGLLGARRALRDQQERHRVALEHHLAHARTEGRLEAMRPTPPRLDRELVAAYAFPAGVLERALRRCPPATRAETVEEGLRQFLVAAGEAMAHDVGAGMPSRTVDEAWHEFVLFTHDYEQFCLSAFGRFLHHEPEATMSEAGVAHNRTAATARTWDGACRAAGLDPHATTVAPALFVADLEAGVPGARRHVATCGAWPCAREADEVCVAHDLRGEDDREPAEPVAVTPDLRSQVRAVAGPGPVAGVFGAGLVADQGQFFTGHHGDGGHHGCGGGSAGCGSAGGGGCGSAGGGCGGGSGCGGGGCGGGS